MKSLINNLTVFLLSVFLSTATTTRVTAVNNNQSPFDVTCTWMAGSNMTNQPTLYGTVGVASPDNIPQSRAYTCMATTYTGPDRAYMFGGEYQLSNYVGDLWMFDVQSAWWTLVHSDATSSLFGIKGIPGPGVFPGRKSRMGCAVSQQDSRFYISHGSRTFLENHVWAFNLTLGQWVWLSGNANMLSSVSVKQGVENVLNIPAARNFHSFTMIPNINSFVLFGGYIYTNRSNLSPQIIMNDVWRFNASSNMWAWLTGNLTTPTLVAVYGNTYFASPLNTPPGVAIHCADFLYGSTTSMFFFGGQHVDNSFNNDIWKYDLDTNWWTFLSSGPNVGLYTDYSDYPGARNGHKFLSIPGTTMFVMLHGSGYAQGGLFYGLSDIWIYDYLANVWYIARNEALGSSIGNYGTLNATDNSTLPPRRHDAPAAFIKNSQTLFVWGGISPRSYYSDAWYIQMNKVSVVATETVSMSVTSIMLNITSNFFSSSTPTVGPTPNADNNWLSKQSQQVIFAVVGLGLCFLTVSTACLLRCVLKKRHKLGSDMSISPTTSTCTTDYTVTTTESSDGTTILADQTEVAIPAFLKYKEGTEFRWNKKIAKGGCGSIYVGDALVSQLQVFGPTIVVKISNTSKYSMDPRLFAAFDQEVAVMSFLNRHKNIAMFLGWCDRPMAILMKYYPLGSLESFVEKRMMNQKSMALQFSKDIASGILFMHTKQVAHCDLKPANVLVDQDKFGRYYCALSDFGIAHMFSANAQLVQAFKVVNMRGVSVVYAALEAVTRYRCRKNPTAAQAFKADVYSLGMNTFSILNGQDIWRHRR